MAAWTAVQYDLREAAQIQTGHRRCILYLWVVFYQCALKLDLTIRCAVEAVVRGMIPYISFPISLKAAYVVHARCNVGVIYTFVRILFCTSVIVSIVLYNDVENFVILLLCWYIFLCQRRHTGNVYLYARSHAWGSSGVNYVIYWSWYKVQVKRYVYQTFCS